MTDTIDIENPGADEAALRAAIGMYAGQVLVQAGTVSAPVTFIDLDLPSGYIQFRIEFYGLKFGSGSDSYNFAAALSFDGGDTYLNDIGDPGFDSYWNAVINKTGSAAVDSSGTSDALMTFPTYSAGSPFSMRLSVDLFPGSADSLAQSIYTAVSDIAGSLLTSIGQASINPAATVTPTPARADHIRFAVYDGYGEIKPPHVGVQITAGTYRLFGVPA